MKHFRNFIALTIALAAFSVAGVSAQSFSGDRVRSERTLEQEIFKKLLTLPRYGVFDHLTYQINGSTVTLGGNTISLGTKSGAESVVKRIPGVTRVVNNINELPPSPYDDRIRRQALQTFASKGLYRYLWEPNPQVRIIVDGGRIALEGYVSNSGDRNLFNIYAHGIPGTFEVKNNLIVGRDARR